MGWSDGAEFKVGAHDALEKIVGASEEVHPMDDAAFEKMIREAPLPPWGEGEVSAENYERCANAAARLVLETYEAYPQTRDLPMEHDYLRGPDGMIVWEPKPPFPVKTSIDIYDVVRQLHPEATDALDLTGFMWGWAVNAARSVLGLGSVPNPALLEVNI